MNLLAMSPCNVSGTDDMPNPTDGILFPFLRIKCVGRLIIAGAVVSP
jgi:hypothetical protein